MIRFVPRIALLLSALVAAGCSDSDSGTQLDIADPSTPQYGKTYEEWAAEWVAYVNRVAPPECASPFTDATGASCQLYQDADSPVFFLVGTFGGVARRNECVVPHGKALFFPLIGTWGDNAGVPSDMLLSDAELKAYVESLYAGLLPESLKLTVDGQSITKLERGGFSSAPYLITIPPDANSYTCINVPGVEGEFAGQVSGYWALLPALAPGKHTVAFQAASHGQVGVEDVNIDVSYTLTVE
ncbi:MAG: hypothetical protein QM756_09330 [Polyangiaceae bacterium]